MEICKCVICKKEFEMPDDYFGVILCESCDSQMNEDPKDKTIARLRTEVDSLRNALQTECSLMSKKWCIDKQCEFLGVCKPVLED